MSDKEGKESGGSRVDQFFAAQKIIEGYNQIPPANSGNSHGGLVGEAIERSNNWHDTRNTDKLTSALNLISEGEKEFKAASKK